MSFKSGKQQGETKTSVILFSRNTCINTPVNTTRHIQSHIRSMHLTYTLKKKKEICIDRAILCETYVFQRKCSVLSENRNFFRNKREISFLSLKNSRYIFLIDVLTSNQIIGCGQLSWGTEYSSSNRAYGGSNPEKGKAIKNGCYTIQYKHLFCVNMYK